MVAEKKLKRNKFGEEKELVVVKKTRKKKRFKKLTEKANHGEEDEISKRMIKKRKIIKNLEIKSSAINLKIFQSCVPV